ncbi:MAG: bifunctional aspartate carbamoyltransferase catalytic subunit/aspartate carbamoyltransferase regulatory subunit [Spirochaetes bacterium]|uniref:Aspartate carbamoyltransferase n=1 Tax=Candidatus Ornithospirochaeta stercoripullorum TaxID=2840899 RepID=A0A9D9DWQ8_9SPIO|nr:bifunctional aspartate carbamoyltransferase catalytic subunit/aspartate carbamoyltransferase regulatory subunit [Candidatus Ornithospirochaeta stercoripullorum]
MASVFASRSLCVIDDLTINERRYFFKKVKELKEAILSDDKAVMDSFRINDPDFGIYEVFLEDSTRTKESFRNAAAFHHAKVSELISSSSSINKGESYADTFNMLSGYHNSIFIVRSKVEGLTKWLSEECGEYAKRNGLPYTPAFINAGDGKHEHPTQELLDEFTFLEDLNMDFDSIHVALVGDLYHGRTVHSKADGLRIFNHVKVDLIAPDELMMPDSYIEKMKENGFEVSIYPSIEEYVKAGKPARLWYFTRPQLERMGERILQKQDILREAITFRRDFLPYLQENTRFYHPLPRHKEHPTIPTWLDKTPLNAWERQAINGMYCRIVLLSLIGGKIGSDYIPVPGEHDNDMRTEEYIIQVEPSKNKKDKNYSEGVRPITDGIVIDHICKGDEPGEIRNHMRLISSILGLDDERGGEWVSRGSDGQYKGIIFRPGARPLERKDLKRLAAVAPHCTLNIIRDGRVAEKYRTHMPPRIYNFDDLCCQNDACVSNPINGEGVPASFYRTPDGHFACAYCGRFHSFKEIWKKRS